MVYPVLPRHFTRAMRGQSKRRLLKLPEKKFREIVFICFDFQKAFHIRAVFCALSSLFVLLAFAYVFLVWLFIFCRLFGFSMDDLQYTAYTRDRLL